MAAPEICLLLLAFCESCFLFFKLSTTVLELSSIFPASSVSHVRRLTPRHALPALAVCPVLPSRLGVQ